MSKRSAVLLSIVLVVSMGAMSMAVGGIGAEQTGTNETGTEVSSVTKTVSINTSIGSGGSERFRAVEPTSDGGYVAVGDIGGFNADLWVVKFDSSGAVSWNKTYPLGDASDSDKTDEGWDVVEADDGYLIAGKDDRNGVLVKIDDQGAKQWAKNYGGYNAEFKAVLSTSDGFVAAGKAESDQGDSQGLLVHVNDQGDEQWSQTYGTIDSDPSDFNFEGDVANDVVKSGDGGFVIAGITDNSEGNDNVWVLKTDGQGVEQWNQSFGDAFTTEQAEGIARDPNGGYVIAAHKQPELWALNIDDQGSKQWDQFYLGGDSGVHSGKSYLSTDITQTNDDNFLILGEETAEDFNAIALKIGGDGTEHWNASFPDNLGAEFSATTLVDVEQSSDGDFVFGGDTEDFGPGTRAGILMKIGFSTGDQTQNQPPSASFSANATTVTTGEGISFTADATDSDGSIASYEWDFDGDGTTDATGSSVEHSFGETGDHVVTLTVTDDDGATDSTSKTITVEADGGTEVRLSPTTGTTGVGGTTTFDVVVSNAPNGISAWDFQVTVGDVSVAKITGIDYPAAVANADTTLADDGSNASSATFGEGLEGGQDVVIATVTVEGVVTQSTDLSLTVNDLTDPDANEYEVTNTPGASIDVVSGPGDVTDDGNAAQDPDGDGTFEDVNGDGSFNIVDVQTFFVNRNSDAVQNNAAFFDFSGDGSVGIVDIQKLFIEATS